MPDYLFRMTDEISCQEDVVPIWPLPSDDLLIPETFPDPFSCPDHPLAVACALKLQTMPEIENHWREELSISGKMFGVLAVETHDGKKGFLAAFSGLLAGKSRQPGFVPPVFDLADETGFFRSGEKELTELNQIIRELEHGEEAAAAKQNLKETEARHKHILEEARCRMEKNKRLRAEKRAGLNTLSDESERLREENLLNAESAREKADFRRLKHRLDEESKAAAERAEQIRKKAEALKKLRKEKSARLQEQLFNAYVLPDRQGNGKKLNEIFREAGLFMPPAGAGDCAAPKLLHFAFTHGLKPLAMAEFWWGASPRDEIRKHGHFYPPCRGKCEPILGHMLRGLTKKSAVQIPEESFRLPIIFEDEHLLAVNKPAGLLSVPGKKNTPSAAVMLGPDLFSVHRLDMDTSGILIFAKSGKVHQKMQKMFLRKEVKKQYTALLEGIFRGEREGTISLPLRTDLNDRPRQMVCTESGKPALTLYRVVSEENGRTRIHFFPVTGRTHQLRVHAAHPLGLNMPIAGDRLYGKKAERLFLHAEKLEFPHPITGKITIILAEPDF